MQLKYTAGFNAKTPRAVLLYMQTKTNIRRCCVSLLGLLISDANAVCIRTPRGLSENEESLGRANKLPQITGFYDDRKNENS